MILTRRKAVITVPADILDQDRYSDTVAAEILMLAEAIRRTDADTPVPSCPGWTARTLATHIGMIHRWVRQTVRDSAREPLEFSQFGRDLPQEWSGFGDWLDSMSEPLSETLRSADPDAPAWSFTDIQQARFWPRRMLHETMIHRVDAELAAGIRPRTEADAAVDGLDELLYLLSYTHPFRSAPADLRGHGETIHIHATDVDVHWQITMTPDGHTWERSDADTARKASAVIRGHAGEVHLFQYNRLSDQVADVECTGDGTVLADWLTRSAL
jgi:uncharacterized protein (TIGR03083 family)